MNLVEIHSTLEQRVESSEQAFPAAPFPRKYIHTAFIDFQDAVQAFIALLGSGYDTQDIYLMRGRDFIEAVELNRTPVGFFCSSDEHLYLLEAKRGKHILSVRFFNYEQMNQVRNLLAPYRAYSMVYVDTWSVTPLIV
ncbi:MAG: hypothetical protein ACXWPS_18330 [Ktedonobacteraceae bacterium]